MSNMEIIASIIIPLLAALLGYLAGGYTERKKHSYDLIVLERKMTIDAYEKLYASVDDLISKSGLAVSFPFQGTRDEQLSFFHQHDHDLSERFFNVLMDSYNPLIINDKKLKQLVDAMNKQVSTLSNSLMRLYNGENVIADANDAQGKMVELREAISKHLSARMCSLFYGPLDEQSTMLKDESKNNTSEPKDASNSSSRSVT